MEWGETLLLGMKRALNAEHIAPPCDRNGMGGHNPFETIQAQFGLNQDGVIRLMREQLKPTSFKLWRARTHGQKNQTFKITLVVGWTPPIVRA